MNILRGIGTALTSYGYGETERRREEALKAEREAQLMAGGAALSRIYAGQNEPGTEGFATDVGTAMRGGVSNPLAAIREPIGSEMYTGNAQTVIGPDGKPTLVRYGNRGGIQEVEGYTPEPPAARAPTRGIPLTAATGDVSIVDPTVMGPTGVRTTPPGSGSGTDRGLPTLQFATQQLEYRYGIRDPKTDDIIGFNEISEDDLHRLAAMAARGEWALGTPLPASVNMNRRENRFQGVMDRAMQQFRAVPEPPSAAHLGPTAYGVPGGGSVVPEPGMAGAPSLEEQARQLRALGYSEEQIRITLGTGR